MTGREDPAGGEAGAEQQWTVELDRLEVEVLWAERVLKVMMPLDPGGWVPPEDIPPLPASLRERAQDLHHRQAHAMDRLAAEMKQVLRERQFTRTGPASSGTRLDLVG